MRKVLVLSLIFFLFGGNDTSAQVMRNYGVKAAVTSANQDFRYSIAPDLKFDRRLGFTFAVFAEWLDMPFVSIVTQIEYAQRGMVDKWEPLDSSGQSLGIEKRSPRLDYLSIPVLLKFRLPSMITPYILAGPRLDVFLGYQSDGIFDIVYDEFKKTALGGSAAVGIQIQSLLPVTILGEARYNVDLSDSYATDYLKVRNNSFDFWLGIAL